MLTPNFWENTELKLLKKTSRNIINASEIKKICTKPYLPTIDLRPQKNNKKYAKISSEI